MGEYFGEILSVEGYELSRFLFYRGLAFIYFIGFLIIKNQYIPLLGRNGLMPIHTFVRHTSFKSHPSLFFSHHGDYLLKGFSYLGLALSLFCLSGLSDQYGLFVSMLCWGALWILYLSYANLGQLFYGYGWESLLLEAGFLAIFLGDFNTPVPWLILWLLRFVNFKNMLGAGLIKLRGDAVWKNLKALFDFIKSCI